MVQRYKLISVKTFIALNVTGLVLFALVLFSSLFLLSVYANHQQRIEQESLSLTRFVAGFSTPYLLAEDADGLSLLLAELDSFASVEHVHVVSYDIDDSRMIFTFYNRPGAGHTQEVFNRIPSKLETNKRLSDNEYLAPIQDGEHHLGYVYLMSRYDPPWTVIKPLLLPMLVIFGVCLLLIWGLVKRLERRFLLPLSETAEHLRNTCVTKPEQIPSFDGFYKESADLYDASVILQRRINEGVALQQLREEENQALTTGLEEKVAKRTQALKSANEELIQTLEQLHQYQRQLVEKEKMASLGNMMTMISSDLRTPVDSSQQAIASLSERIAQINTDFEEKQLRTRTMKRFLQESNTALDVLQSNMLRLNELFARFSQMTSRQQQQQSSAFNLRDLIDDLILTIEQKSKRAEIQVQCDSQLMIESRPDAINQVLFNLLEHSLSSASEHIKINIDVSEQRGAIDIIYRDNSSSFTSPEEEDLRSQQTFKLIEGTIVQVLNGTLRVVADETSHTELVINFPIDRRFDRNNATAS